MLHGHPTRRCAPKPNVAWRAAGLAVVLALGASSCGLFSSLNRPSAAKLESEARLTQLESDIMRLGDQAILDLSGSARQFSRALDTPDAKRQALLWTVSHTNRVLSIVSNPKPLAALVDLLLFASVQRVFHEEYWMPKVHGEADRPMLEAFQRLEASCWSALGNVLSRKQQETLRGVLAQWREDNPDLGRAVAVEAPSFARVAAPISESGRVPLVSDLIELVSLDPLGGLEPAVREVAVTRQLGERIFFYSQHMPKLLEQELELLTQRTLSLPEVRSGVEGAERLSLAAESLAATAALLPQSLREARAGVVADLEGAREPLQDLLCESRETLDAATRAAASVTSGITALHEFVNRPEVAAADSSPASPGPRPFDVREYGEAATRIGAAAHELTAAVAAADQRLPQALDEAAVRVERSVDHLYARLLRLLFWAAALASAAILLARLCWTRLAQGGARAGSSSAAGSNGSAANRGRHPEPPQPSRPRTDAER
jgi:hypothetical protein